MSECLERGRANGRFLFGVVVAGLVPFLSSCVPTPTQTVEMSYTDSEFGAYKGQGDAVVTGQAFLRQEGGGVVVCAGEPVLLFPHTSSFERLVNLAKQHIRPIMSETADPRFKKIARKTTCDAQGNFRFDELPRAPWYIFTQVRWTVSDYAQGGALIGTVDTSHGGQQRVLLTDANRG